VENARERADRLRPLLFAVWNSTDPMALPCPDHGLMFGAAELIPIMAAFARAPLTHSGKREGPDALEKAGRLIGRRQVAADGAARWLALTCGGSSGARYGFASSTVWRRGLGLLSKPGSD
jgi:hypothetical protein